MGNDAVDDGQRQPRKKDQHQPKANTDTHSDPYGDAHGNERGHESTEARKVSHELWFEIVVQKYKMFWKTWVFVITNSCFQYSHFIP